MILTITLNTSIDRRFVTSGAKQGEVNRVLECTYTAGGKGLNVSRILKLSGEKLLAGGLAGGYAGKYIEAELDNMQIPYNFYHVAGESRSCINIWDKETKQQTEYLEPGFVVTQEEAEGFRTHFQAQIQDADILTISGSVPKGIDTDFYRDLIAAAKGCGKKVILDTSGELLVSGIQAKPTVIKPNIDEIRTLTGRKCEDLDQIIDAAEMLHSDGVEYVVISLGGKGSVMKSTDGVYQTIIPEIKTVNTVGCGDSMVAGLAIGLKRDYSSEELLKQAAAIATAAAMSEGTGYYEQNNMKQIYDQIMIRKLR